MQKKNPSTVASVYDQFQVTHKDYSEVMNKETFSNLGNMEETGSQKMDRRVRVFFGKRGVGPSEELTISSSRFLSLSH